MLRCLNRMPIGHVLLRLMFSPCEMSQATVSTPGISLEHRQEQEMRLQSARSPNPQSQPCCSLIPDKQGRRQQQINYEKIRGICSNSLFPSPKEQTLQRLLALLIRRTKETKVKVNLRGNKNLLCQPVLRTVCGVGM